MLASIHPLGERARHNRWAVTAVAYTVGSTAAGGLLGGLIGGAGAGLRRVARPDPILLGGLAALVCLGTATVELGRGQAPIPSLRRQVNEDWLNRYRGWVYGLGFGSQLGLGVATIITTAAVYATLTLAFLAGWASRALGAGAAAGTVIGAGFGLVRALPLLLFGRAHQPDQLRAVHRSLTAAAPMARRLAAAGLLVTAGLLGVAVLA